VNVVAKGMGLDRRIGPKFLHAGPGFGGSCFPKDTKALIRLAEEHDTELSVVRAAITANEKQKGIMFNRIRQSLSPLKSKVVAILGVSFKPNTDDLREAPSLHLIENLLREKARVRVYDPAAMDNAKTLFPQVAYCKDPYEAAKGADALVIVTEWNQFRNLDLERMKGLLRKPFFFDLRNIYEPEKVKKLGFTYFCVGRP